MENCLHPSPDKENEELRMENEELPPTLRLTNGTQ